MQSLPKAHSTVTRYVVDGNYGENDLVLPLRNARQERLELVVKVCVAVQHQDRIVIALGQGLDCPQEGTPSAQQSRHVVSVTDTYPERSAAAKVMPYVVPSVAHGTVCRSAEPILPPKTRTRDTSSRCPL